MAIIIVQQPDTLSLSGNLKDLVVQTDSALQVTLSTGSDTVLDETYYPGNGNLVHLNFSDVINAYLAYSLPNTDIYLQTKLSAAFTVSLANDTNNTTLSFSAIKGGKLHLNESASQFLKGNFLTWQPIQKQVTYYSPEWLTYYAPSACSIMLKAYWEDGSTSTKTLVSPSAGYCYTVNLQYAVVSGMFDGKRPMYYDVWVESGGARLTYVQRYVASELQSDNEHWFLFENSLGGMDSVRAYGSQADDPEYDYHMALRGNEGENYRIDVERVRSVNTGYLTPEETRWLQDLFATRKAYVYTATGLYPIILTAGEGATEGDDEPSSFSFGYRFADVRPYLDIQRRTDLPENLTIPVPTGETFFLPPRLAEFPKQALSPDLLIPVEEPHTEAWGTITAGMLHDSVLNALINALKGIDLNLIGNGGSDIEIIKQFDLTTPTDNNVFSSLRTLLEINKVSGDFNEALEDLMRRIMAMFLRKDIDDTAAGFITFLKGLRSADFTMGEFGNGFILKYENGESYFEIDRMLVRKAAYFVELIIKQLSHVGGQIVLTPASMRCSKVDEYLDFYRCYFENEKDGKKIEQEFKVGDQARCQTFNVEVGVNENVGNQYYWRLVTYVGENFIDLSKIDCDLGSTPPMEGDDIVLLGNRTDKTRQNAIILSSIGEDAPSFKQYEGIDSYSLAGKEVTVISPKGNKLKGDFLSTSGKDLDRVIDEFGTKLEEVATQTDKTYMMWFYPHVPTLDNLPASEWLDDAAKSEHVQDMFYVEDGEGVELGDAGRAYRFKLLDNGDFGWEEITDKDTIMALEKAAKAQGTADSKIRNFVDIPYPPYEIGDRWSNAYYSDETVDYDNDDLVCVRSKTEYEVFDISDWQPVSGQDSKSRKKIEADIKNLGDSLSLVVSAFQLNDEGKYVLTSAAGAVISSEMAKLYATKGELNSSFSILADEIYSKVSDSEFNSAVTQLSKSIESKVSSSDFGTTITQLRDEISLKLENGNDVVSAINLVTNGVKIKGSVIVLDGAVTSNNTFKVDTNGDVFIGGFSVIDNKLVWKENTTGSALTLGASSYGNHGIVDVNLPFTSKARFGIKAIGYNPGGAAIYASAETTGISFPPSGKDFAAFFVGSVDVRSNITMTGLVNKEGLVSDRCTSSQFGYLASRNDNGLNDVHIGVTWTQENGLCPDLDKVRLIVEGGIITGYYSE